MLNNQFTVNLDDTTAARVQELAEFYQRKPAELLRLLLVPQVLDQYIKMENEKHPTNQEPPKLAKFNHLIF